MINTLYQFGDQVKLTPMLNVKKMLQELEPFEKKWSQYNPSKPYIRREGLCVLNEKGKCGPGPALDSIPEYNKRNGTNLKEHDFNIPTELYNSSLQLQQLLKDFLPHCCRIHFLKLKSGCYFPTHRDHLYGNQRVIRLIVPIINCNPPNMRFLIEDKTLHWNHGQMYMVNTTKEHSLFNMNDDDSIWLVINMIVTEESKNIVIDNLLIR